MRARPLRWMRRRGTDERGVVLVEFAFVMPLLLALVLGIVDFGRGLNYWIQSTHLSSEGARYAAVNSWPGCPPATSGTCGVVPGTTSLQNFIKSVVETKELSTAVKVCVESATPQAGQTVKVTVLDTSFEWMGFKFFGWNKTSRIGSSAQMRLETNPTHLTFDPASCTT